MRKIFATLLCMCYALIVFSQSQSDKDKAHEMLLEAIEKMDNGAINESIKILEKSKKLDPDNYVHTYEIGYAYCLKKDYKKSIKVLKKVLKYDSINDECFTLLGNVYDFNKQPEKAIATYEKGLKKFPNSGRLYFETGIVKQSLKQYNDALNAWEKGLEMLPTYPSNYYASSVFYSSYTSEKIWGVLYGELFMNLERGSNRTENMSKILFDTYKSAITIESPTKVSVNMSQSIPITLSKKDEELKMPFSMYFMTDMLISTNSLTATNDKQIDIKALNKIRTAFINHWYSNKRNVEYPNILFDWHKKLIDLGYFEAYNYWLFMKGNEEEFSQWYNKNEFAFEKFVGWFNKNPMPIDKENKFYRFQY